MTTRVESSSVLVSQERLIALVQKWRWLAEHAESVVSALALSACAADLDRILLSAVPRAQEHEQETEAQRIVSFAMNALETGSTHDQRRAAWNALRDHFWPLNPSQSSPILAPETSTMDREMALDWILSLPTPPRPVPSAWSDNDWVNHWRAQRSAVLRFVERASASPETPTPQE